MKQEPDLPTTGDWINKTLHEANDLEHDSYPFAILIKHDDGSGYLKALAATHACTLLKVVLPRLERMSASA